MSGAGLFWRSHSGSVHRNTQIGFQVHSGCTIVRGEPLEALFLVKIFKKRGIQAFENGKTERGMEPNSPDNQLNISDLKFYFGKSEFGLTVLVYFGEL